MSRLISLIVSMLLFSGVFAQQEEQFTQNMFNHLDVNPGFAGDNGEICGTILSRNQWMGLEGAPVSRLISIDGKFEPIKGGAGITILQDEIGASVNNQVKLSYAYRGLLNGKLGLGIGVKFLNQQLDMALLKPVETDPLLTSSEQKDMLIDLTIGGFYREADKLYFGVSTSQNIQAQGEYPGVPSGFKMARHYYITGGYYYDLQTQPITLNPSVFIKSDGASTQFSINCLGIYNKKYWGGLTYRNEDAVAILLGAMPFTSKQLAPLKLGLAYDLTTSQLNSYSNGTFEVMLGYCFKIEIELKEETYRNVRNL